MFFIFRHKTYSSRLYPSHWPNSFDEGLKIEVSKEVYKKLKRCFQGSINQSVRVISIKEICNYDFFERYMRLGWSFILLCLFISQRKTLLGIYEYVVAELSLIKIQSQKQRFIDVLKKRCSEKMQQIYRRATMLNTFFRIPLQKNWYWFGVLFKWIKHYLCLCFSVIITSGIKVGHLHLSQYFEEIFYILLTFFISNIGENIFLSRTTSGSKGTASFSRKRHLKSLGKFYS